MDHNDEKVSKSKVVVHFVRHAQSQHNVKTLSYSEQVQIRNPALTKHGKEQSKALLSSFSHMSKINIILVSPLNRTLETVLHAFTPLLSRGIKVYPYPDLTEWGKAPCNDFQDGSSVMNNVPDLKKEIALLFKHADTKAEDKRMDRVSRVLRVKKALFSLGQALKTPGSLWMDVPVGEMGGNEESVEILVVSHGGFLGSLLDVDRHLFNAEFRSYEFASDEMVKGGAMPYDLVETEESKAHEHIVLQENRKLRFVLLEHEFTPEERMAMLPKYAWTPPSDDGYEGESEDYWPIGVPRPHER